MTSFSAVRKVSGDAKSFSSKTPSKMKDGDLIMDHSSLINMWSDFLEGKFKQTDTEDDRDDAENIGGQAEEDPLTKETFLGSRSDNTHH